MIIKVNGISCAPSPSEDVRRRKSQEKNHNKLQQITINKNNIKKTDRKVYTNATNEKIIHKDHKTDTLTPCKGEQNTFKVQ